MTVASLLSPQAFVDHVFAQSGVLPVPHPLAYGTELSPYLHVGPDQVASPDTGEVALLPALVALDARARELFGAPLGTSAGYRTVRHEEALRAKGLQTANWVSPHTLATALDKHAAPRAGETLAAVNARIRHAYTEAARALGLPRPRCGHLAYGERFVHVDLVFLLFHPYTTLPHPSTWQELSPRLRASLVAWQPGVEW